MFSPSYYRPSIKSFVRSGRTVFLYVRRENQRMKELMSEPLEVNRYQTWLPSPPPPPPPQRMARIVETSLRDDSRLPDSIYMMRRPATANGTAASYGRSSTPPPPPPYWRGSLENLYEAPPPPRPHYSSYEPDHFRNYRRSCPPRSKTTRLDSLRIRWRHRKLCFTRTFPIAASAARHKSTTSASPTQPMRPWTADLLLLSSQKPR